ncbi:MAG: RNA 3'-terminal phosphate cyclase [Candidatus Thorarchaeota archaeon]|nr:MAG: RNA 3'-terminal phosphate cyclase [Candidatus Thorarchaeota archaeon]
MIEIDGSHGEGGGQILRTSVALSALTMRPVRISRIRAGRPKPGLKRQHMAGIDIIAQLVDAKVSGLDIGSTAVEFSPQGRRGGHYSYDVGTAGSISLILQAALPTAALAPEPITLSLTGGTDVSWSPPIDYMREVFAHSLQRMGLHVEVSLRKRGHFPRGGGRVSCTITPVEELTPLELVYFGDLVGVSGISHCVRLPPHVARRQADSAQSVLRENGIEQIAIDTESYQKNEDRHLGPGSGIVIWAESEQGAKLGADRLGERGKPAEDVGSECAHQLIDELSTGMAVDSHLCDMLVPYMVLAKGTSMIGVTKITSHLETNLWVAQIMLSVDFSLEGAVGGPGKLTVRGVGFSLRD